VKSISGCVMVVAVSVCLSAQGRPPASQGPDSTIKPLQVLESVVVKSQPGESMQLPVRCDDTGNIYVRFFHGRVPFKEPVIKFDSKGQRQAAYSITDDPDFQGRGQGALDFSIGSGGEVYFLATTLLQDQIADFIVPFSSDGKLRPKMKLEDNFTRDRFGVFGSGNFLVTGTGRETEANATPHSIHNEIVDSGGKLVKKLILPEDAKYEEAANRGDSDFFELERGGGGNYAVERGMLTRGSDGNLYMLRWTVPAQVYVISPSGELLHSFEVTAQLEGKKPASIHADGGHVAIQFEGNDKYRRSLIAVVGLDGREYATYDSTGLGVAFACYSEPDRFTFLKGGDQLQIITYAPK